jgi:hypothetical protein
MHDRVFTQKRAEVSEPVAYLAASKADFIRGFDIDAAPSL